MKKRPDLVYDIHHDLKDPHYHKSDLVRKVVGILQGIE